jgi:16S rRNA (uracil1498-N3)-methyltransferase
MKQFILPAPPDGGGEICLSGKDFHYLARVRRLKAGAELNALLPSGEAVRFRIKSVGRDSLVGAITTVPSDTVPVSDLSDTIPPIVLFQGLPKPAKMDLIVRQAAEGGINEIRPFTAEYSAAGARAGDGGRTERWRRIIREARQQSGSPVDTSVSPPCTTEALLEYWEALRGRASRPVGILLHHERNLEGGGPLAQGSLHRYLGNAPDLVVFAIGPEGGFSGPEVARFLEAGFKALVIGNTVLRTETAALYAAAAIRIILLESAWWTPAAPDSQNGLRY